MSNQVHRGRTKKGSKTLQIHLTSEEWAALKRIAECQLRSASAQAVWIIKQMIGPSTDSFLCQEDVSQKESKKMSPLGGE